jgi:DNA-binding NarL/FixJ family response regulator
MVTKILLYEDNDDLRNSVVAMLQWNSIFDVVAAMPDAIGAIKDVELLKPDVVLMDIDMPNSNGVDAVTQIRRVNTHIPIIMFTVFDDDENIFNAICAGANGYILKKNFEQLPNAIEDVLTGGAPMNSAIAKKVLGFVTKSKVEKNKELEELTKRELQILEFVVKGYSYKMISTELDIATETVRTHIKKIYKKLQVNSATGAVYKYNQSKLSQ